MATRKIRGILGKIFVVLMALAVPVSNAGAATLDGKILDDLYANGAYYYDPCGGVSGGGASGSGLLPGSSNKALAWNYFATANIPGVSDNAMVIAGILGNLQQESTLNPLSHTAGSQFYGIYQTNAVGFMKIVDEYRDYFDGKAKAGPAIVSELMTKELDYLTQKNPRFTDGKGGGDLDEKVAFVKNLDKVAEKTPEAYADLFLVAIERAIGGPRPTWIEDAGVIKLMEGTTLEGKHWQDADRRREFAREFYDDYLANGGSTSSTSTQTDSEGWVGGIENLKKDSAVGKPMKQAQATKFKTKDGKPSMIVLHYTAGDSNTGLGTYGDNLYPAHFTIDLKKKFGYQHFPLNMPAMAVVGYDEYAIQIEITGVGYKNWAGADAESDYNLANFGDAEWDYLAYYLNAISKYTGIPLESTVVWPENENEIKRLTPEEAEKYRGILGHMHLPKNEHKVDPGNIWPQVEAALKRNPAAGTYSELCGGEGGGVGGPVSGGLTLKQAKVLVNVYKNAQRYNPAGEKKENAFARKWNITNTYGGVNDKTGEGCRLANCTAFVQYFLNRYTKYYNDLLKRTGKGVGSTGHGGATAKHILNKGDKHGFTGIGTTPKPYAIFSTPSGKWGHTGIVLGVNEQTGRVIIGEAGLNGGCNFTGAKEESLEEYSSGSYKYTYMNGQVLLDEIQKTIDTGE